MSEAFLGEVKMFGGNYSPRGYAYCDGSLFPISEHQSLFSLLGTTYGGNGQTNFGLPNLQGRTPMHKGNGIGLTPRRLGEMSGIEHIGLKIDQIPSHTHQMIATSENGIADIDVKNDVSILGKTVIPGARGRMTPVPFYTTDVSQIDSMASEAISNVGGDVNHYNMQPYLTVNFIICLDGIYPSRN